MSENGYDPARPRPDGCALIAENIAKALGGHKVGSTWMAHCPAHDDREPSLSVSAGDEGKVLVHCHAGCNQRWVIAALRMRGLWEDDHRGEERFIRPDPYRKGSDRRESDEERTRAALRIWQETMPAAGTLVEIYLQSRGIAGTLPHTLRFHAGLKHLSDSIWPMMVALLTRGSDNAPLAIHRTFLARDGVGKAPVAPQKMMLGPCRGGAVSLGRLGEVLMVGEGIENCLSAMQATGITAWAALSTSGLRALELPEEAREVIVLADGDDPGEAAARDCAHRWKREGRSVRIARPPRGCDFNDLLRGRVPCIEEGGA